MENNTNNKLELLKKSQSEVLKIFINHGHYNEKSVSDFRMRSAGEYQTIDRSVKDIFAQYYIKKKTFDQRNLPYTPMFEEEFIISMSKAYSNHKFTDLSAILLKMNVIKDFESRTAEPLPDNVNKLKISQENQKEIANKIKIFKNNHQKEIKLLDKLENLYNNKRDLELENHFISGNKDLQLESRINATGQYYNQLLQGYNTTNHELLESLFEKKYYSTIQSQQQQYNKLNNQLEGKQTISFLKVIIKCIKSFSLKPWKEYQKTQNLQKEKDTVEHKHLRYDNALKKGLVNDNSYPINELQRNFAFDNGFNKDGCEDISKFNKVFLKFNNPRDTNFNQDIIFNRIPLTLRANYIFTFEPNRVDEIISSQYRGEVPAEHLQEAQKLNEIFQHPKEKLSNLDENLAFKDNTLNFSQTQHNGQSIRHSLEHQKNVVNKQHDSIAVPETYACSKKNHHHDIKR